MQMREILFRGKRADNGEWVEGFYFEEIGSFIKKPQSSVSTPTYLIIPETRGLFTGLTDKNGVKIFEGDIIKAIWQHLGSTDTVVGSVVFIDASFVLETKEHFLFFEDNIFAVDCEVIGNIHDNPELLEGDNDDESN